MKLIDTAAVGRLRYTRHTDRKELSGPDWGRTGRGGLLH